MMKLKESYRALKSGPIDNALVAYLRNNSSLPVAAELLQGAKGRPKCARVVLAHQPNFCGGLNLFWNVLIADSFRRLAKSKHDIDVEVVFVSIDFEELDDRLIFGCFPSKKHGARVRLRASTVGTSSRALAYRAPANSRDLLQQKWVELRNNVLLLDSGHGARLNDLLMSMFGEIAESASVAQACNATFSWFLGTVLDVPVSFVSGFDYYSQNFEVEAWFDLLGGAIGGQLRDIVASLTNGQIGAFDREVLECLKQPLVWSHEAQGRIPILTVSRDGKLLVHEQHERCLAFPGVVIDNFLDQTALKGSFSIQYDGGIAHRLASHTLQRLLKIQSIPVAFSSWNYSNSEGEQTPRALQSLLSHATLRSGLGDNEGQFAMAWWVAAVGAQALRDAADSVVDWILSEGDAAFGVGVSSGRRVISPSLAIG